MKISLEHISKRFQRHWIFKDINYTFSAGKKYALLGANGSGKSTLQRIIAGMQASSLGKVFYSDSEVISKEKIFSHISFCAPSMELVEELTLSEFLHFHFSYKKIIASFSIGEVIAQIGLQNDANRQLGDFSSGMKQRVKLAQAFFTDSSVLLLDEPCTNLDEAGLAQYQSWIDNYTQDRLVIIASNDAREYFFCKEQLQLEDYK